MVRNLKAKLSYRSERRAESTLIPRARVTAYSKRLHRKHPGVEARHAYLSDLACVCPVDCLAIVCNREGAVLKKSCY